MMQSYESSVEKIETTMSARFLISVVFKLCSVFQNVQHVNARTQDQDLVFVDTISGR